MASNECAAQRREHRGRGSVAKALVAYADTVQPGSGADGREVPCFTESVTPPAAHFHVSRLMRPPALIKPYVVSFARQVLGVADASPLYVPSLPAEGAPYNECFPLVESHVAKYGGSVVFGWAIWERPKVILEAEFHAIWRAHDGGVADISPRQFSIPRILFAEDKRRKYKGVAVDNIRKSLTNDKDVHRFLVIAAERFRLMNEGDLKHQFGEIEATPAMLSNIKQGALLEQKLLQRYGPWLPEETATTHRVPLKNHVS